LFPGGDLDNPLNENELAEVALAAMPAFRMRVSLKWTVLPGNRRDVY